LRQVIDAVNQVGQHAIVFGERGVGKTSLVKVLSERMGGAPILAPLVTCDSADDYSTVSRKVADAISLVRQRLPPGIARMAEPKPVDLTTAVPRDRRLTTDDVRRFLTHLTLGRFVPIVVIDEFDQLAKDKVKSVFADTIKVLSDHSVGATLVLVGVADSVSELISEHQSVERALVQVKIPRMTTAELREIIERGLARLKLSITPDAEEYITNLSQGLPHFTHLLALHSARAALDRSELLIDLPDVESALNAALVQTQQSIRSVRHKAVSSPRKDNLFGIVLLACALAPKDDLGYFKPSTLREPMRVITGRDYGIPSYARHLSEFCESARGPVLQKSGTKHRFRYRFLSPLVQPFVIMQGIKDGLIRREHVGTGAGHLAD
jgi:Cdc6-like AAA superfamily ATPase